MAVRYLEAAAHRETPSATNLAILSDARAYLERALAIDSTLAPARRALDSLRRAPH